MVDVIPIVGSLCKCIVNLEASIVNDPDWKWLRDNELHPKAARCSVVLVDLLDGAVGQEGLEEYSSTFGPIYRESHPFLYREWLLDNGDDSLSEEDFYMSYIFGIVSNYCAVQSDLNEQWVNLYNLMDVYRLNGDPALEIILLMLNRGPCTRLWSIDDFDYNRGAKSLAQARTIFESLLEINWYDVTNGTTEMKILSRWCDGEDALYLKLVC